MTSRDKNQTTPHQPLLSSLVVRPSTSDGGGGGGGRASDYEAGEVRREPPSYSRSDRYSGDSGSSLWFMLWFYYFAVYRNSQLELILKKLLGFSLWFFYL